MKLKITKTPLRFLVTVCILYSIYAFFSNLNVETQQELRKGEIYSRNSPVFQSLQDRKAANNRRVPSAEIVKDEVQVQEIEDQVAPGVE